MIYRDMIFVDLKKVEMVVDQQRLTNVMEIRRFLDLARYYRRFVEGLSKIIRSLTKLTQKYTKFE